MFLLIDKSKDAKRLPYAQQYMLFEEFPPCLEEAIARGFTDAWGMFGPGPPRPGMMNIYSCGDVDVSIMNIQCEVQR